MSRKTLVYVSGPMSLHADTDWNYRAFNDLATRLRGAGFDVINPAELSEPDSNVAWSEFLRRDITELMKCTHVALLPDWQLSKGAQLEVHNARELGMEIIYPMSVDNFIAEAVA